MVLQIIADAGRIEHDLDAVLLEQVRRPDAGQLQQLRRVVGAAGDQDLLARLCRAKAVLLPVFNRLGAAALEQDALRQRRGFDMQIAALQRRTQIGECAGGAAAAPRRGLEEAGAFLALAVEIRIGGEVGALSEINGLAPPSPCDLIIYYPVTYRYISL